MTAETGLGSVSEFQSEFPIAPDPKDGLGQSCRVTALKEKASLSVSDEVGYSPDGGGHNRGTERHGFKNDVGCALGKRRIY
jgi:hypothetical protein